MGYVAGTVQGSQRGRKQGYKRGVCGSHGETSGSGTLRVSTNVAAHCWPTLRKNCVRMQQQHLWLLKKLHRCSTNFIQMLSSTHLRALYVPVSVALCFRLEVYTLAQHLPCPLENLEVLELEPLSPIKRN